MTGEDETSNRTDKSQPEEKLPLWMILLAIPLMALSTAVSVWLLVTSPI